jgi:hypothetical protein
LARAVAHQVTNLRRRFALACQHPESDYLLSGVHILTLTVLDHRGLACQLFREALDLDQLIYALRQQPLQGSETATAAGYAQYPISHVVRDQVMQ